MTIGEYVVILSGDDFFHDIHSFEKQVYVLEANKKYSACVVSFRKIWNSGEYVICHTPNLNASLYWSGAYTHISCYMFRKTVYNHGMFLERFCDDTGLEYSIALMGNWRYLDDVTFSYRQRDESIMHKVDEMELALIELLLFQDVCLKGRFKLSSLSRFSRPLNYVLDHWENIKEDKYQKYVYEGKKYHYDFISFLMTFSERSVLSRLGLTLYIRCTKLLGYIYWLCREACLVIRR